MYRWDRSRLAIFHQWENMSEDVPGLCVISIENKMCEDKGLIHTLEHKWGLLKALV